MSATNKIALYKFEDSVESSKMIIAGNLLLVVTLAMFGVEVGAYHRLLICLVTAITFYIIYKIYDWNSVSINAFLIALYMGIIFAEIGVLGIPQGAAYLQDYSGMNKGVMLDIFVAGGPYIYMAFRVFLVIPLMQIFLRSRSLK